MAAARLANNSVSEGLRFCGRILFAVQLRWLLPTWTTKDTQLFTYTACSVKCLKLHTDEIQVPGTDGVKWLRGIVGPSYWQTVIDRTNIWRSDEETALCGLNVLQWVKCIEQNATLFNERTKERHAAETFSSRYQFLSQPTAPRTLQFSEVSSPWSLTRDWSIRNQPPTPRHSPCFFEINLILATR